MTAEPIIPGSYWVEDTLAVGEYPGSLDPDEAADKVGQFVQAGVTTFIDLTHSWDDLAPYAHLLAGQTRRCFPIVDNDVPTVAEMTAILDAIDAALNSGEIVYVHCWGGHGRTGTVVGCWLVRRGYASDEAIERIRELRLRLPDLPANPDSPQTDAQHAFVHAWPAGT